MKRVLITGITGCQVSVSRIAIEYFCNLHQDSVTGRMPILVIDAFKVIDIDHYQGKR